MSKINSAESIRGLACMAVVFSHLSLIYVPFLHNFESLTSSGYPLVVFFHNSPFCFLFSGTAAVYVFFVLSGYVLSYAILSKNSVNEKIASMAVKRYPRLAIPAFTSCILTFFILYFVEIDTSNVSSWIQLYGKSGTFLNAIYEGTLGAFIFGESSLNFVLWTMQIELIASFIIFFLLYIFYNKSRFTFNIFATLLPLIFIPISLKLVLGTYAFVLGMQLYIYGKKTPSLLTMTALIVGLYFAGVHTTSSSYSFFTDILGAKAYQLLNFIAGFLIVYGVLFNDKVSLFLDKRPFVLLGKLSFSIYLLHVILLYTVSIPLFNSLYEYLNYSLAAFVSALITIILILVLSYFYSKYIDDFSIKVANSIEKKVRKIQGNKVPTP
ncbi:acyltransferase family protein [Acinetobacter sp. ULE_I001]|uniref:acyltransferase family protein n=1 Tax=unclassified Acinetobacter TaxID=196816 RepID=UPI003AF8DF5F